MKNTATLEMLRAEDAAAANPSRKGKPLATFAIRDLSVLAYANGFTLWHYKGGATSMADVLAYDFFLDARGMMAAGDMIMVSLQTGATIVAVAEADQKGVTVARMA